MAGEEAGGMREHVGMLLQSKRYDPDILPYLEKFVDHQVANSEYDADANMACLKLYQFYPERYQGTIVAKILVKALMCLPESDYLCALYLIPEKFQVDGGPIPILSELVSALETGKYAEFWDAAAANKHLLNGVKGFDDAVREFMLSVISRTYSRITKQDFKRLLNVDDAGLDRIVEENGFETEPDVIVLPPNDENQPKPKKIGEQCSFKQASRIIF